FRSAQCDLALTNLAAAKHEFELARDYDTLAFRADTPINAIISRAGQHHEHDGVTLVNAAEALATNDVGGATGEDLFYEHVHFTFEGNYRLARLFVAQVTPHLPSSITNHATQSWASLEACDRALAVSPWDRYRLWQANFS